MSRLLNIFKRKDEHAPKRNNAGFSLTELLAVLVIMTLVGTVVAASIPSAHRAYVNATDASNAHVLLQTTATRLRDVLSVADPGSIKTESLEAEAGKAIDASAISQKDQAKAEIAGKVLAVFTSLETGWVTVIFNSDDGLKMLQINTAGGVSPNNNGESVRLVPEAVGGSVKRGGDNQLRSQVGGGISYEGGIFTVTGLRVVQGTAASENPFANAEIASLMVKVLAA